MTAYFPEQRKETLIASINTFLAARVEKAPDEATREKAVEMVKAYMIKAEAQPAEFYADCKDIGAAMKKLNALN